MPDFLRSWMLAQSDYFEKMGATLARPAEAEHTLLDTALRRWATD
jgi:hypothetical protein